MMLMNQFAFGELVRGFREREGLRQHELADKLGVHRNTIGDWERGKYLPNTREMVIDLADALGLPQAERNQLFFAASFPLDIDDQKSGPSTLGTSTGSYRPPPLQRPPSPDHFVGRQELLTYLVANLEPGRTITLCGPAGIGKSALAAKAIWALAPGNTPPERFPHGIIYHNFYHQPQTSILFEHILRSYDETPRPNLVTATRRLLAGRIALIVLDGAEAADDLPSFMQVRGECCILITSRRRKDAVVERLDLRPLKAEEASTLLRSWSDGRAADEPTVYEICRLVGFLPLAVRLIGRYLAQTESTAHSYLEWLTESPLEALHQGMQGQESVPLVLNRSLAQLSPNAIDCLSVIGALAEAPLSAQVVEKALDLSSTSVSRDLGELVSYGLLIRPGFHYEVSHRLIRVYIRDKLPAGESQLQRIFEYYADRFDDSDILTFEQFALLKTDWSHLLELARVSSRHSWHVQVLTLAGILSEFFNVSGRVTELSVIAELALAAAQSLGDVKAEARWLSRQAVVESARGRLASALTLHSVALNRSRDIGDVDGQVRDLINRSSVLSQLGSENDATSGFLDALDLSHTIDSLRLRSRCEGNFGTHLLVFGHLDEGIRRTQNALSQCAGDEDGSLWDQQIWLTNLSAAFAIIGDKTAADDYLRRAARLSDQSDYFRMRCYQLSNSAYSSLERGQIADAIDQGTEALKISQEIGERAIELHARLALGVAFAGSANADQGTEHLRQALKLETLMDAPFQKMHVNAKVGGAYRLLGDVAAAIGCFERVLELERETPNPRMRIGAAEVLGELLTYELDAADNALAHFTMALDSARDIGDTKVQLAELLNVGKTLRRLRRFEDSFRVLAEALHLSEQTADREHEADALCQLGLAHSEAGHRDVAEPLMERALYISREISDRGREGRCLGNLAGIAQDSGNLEMAVDLYRQAHEASTAVKDLRDAEIWLHNLGVICSDKGDFGMAEDYYRQALRMTEETGARALRAACLNGLADIYRNTARSQESLNAAERSLALYRELGNQSGMMSAFHALGLAHDQLGEIEQAVVDLDQALTISRRSNDAAKEADILTNLGTVIKRSGDVKGAVQRYQQALSILDKHDDEMVRCILFGNLGNAYRDLGEYDKTILYRSQALQLSRKSGNIERQHEDLTELANAYRRLGDSENWLRCIEEILRLQPEAQKANPNLDLATSERTQDRGAQPG